MKYYNQFKKIILLIGVALVICRLNMQAQPFVEQTGISLTGVWLSSVAWGDYDNDGDLDILLAGNNSSGLPIAKIYRNHGSNTFIEQTGISLTGVGYGFNTVNCFVAWGDYDNDNDLDIVLTGDNSSGLAIAKIYRNNGDNTFTEQINITLTGVIGSSVDWGDYDNDGDLDLLLCGALDYNNTVSKIYRNNGNNTFTEQISILLTGIMTGTVSWGDYNKDGYKDILLIGYSAFWYNPVSKIYKNNGDNTFSEQTSLALLNVGDGMSSWGDYNNDGYLDILLTGYNGSKYESRIYRNNGNSTFSNQTGISFAAVQNSTVVWGDYDNDGDPDLLLSGMANSGPFVSKIYKNNGNNTFSEQTSISLTGVAFCSSAWGDYDNDGDLDILLTGTTKMSGGTKISKIYRNDIITANKAPDAPTSLISSVIGTDVILKWNSVRTDTTPYKGMTYNVRVVTTSGASNIVSPQSLPNGYRLIPAMGNAQLDTSFILKNLPAGTYYWSVQAVDNGFMGGAFSTEGTFTILPLTAVPKIQSSLDDIKIYPNPTSGIIELSVNEEFKNNYKIDVFNSLGILIQTTVKQKDKGTSQIDLSGYPAGMYIVKIESKNELYQTRIIKKKQ